MRHEVGSIFEELSSQEAQEDISYIKSSFCNTGTCVETAFPATGDILLRDGKNPGVVVNVGSVAWGGFIEGLRNGALPTFEA